MRPSKEQIKEGERWYVDGKPGTVYIDPYPTGYFTFHYDGAGFGTNMNANDLADNWERCEESAKDLQTARAREALAKLGIKI
jgi:hypothetical protein